MNNVKEYYNAQKQIRTLFKLETKKKEEIEKRFREITWEYRDKIYALEREKNEKISIENAKKETILKEIKEQEAPYNIIINTTEEFFKLIDIYVDNIFLFLTPDKDLPLLLHDIEEHEKKSYESRLKNEPIHLQPLDLFEWDDHDANGNYIKAIKKNIPPVEMLVDDDVKKVGVYIIKNKKPVNKYTLTIESRSIFDYSQKYLHLNNAPNTKILMTYYEKNRAKIIEGFVSPYIIKEKAYVEAIELFKDPVWRMAYMLDKKDYYENRYSRGVDTKEYRMILKEIKNLKEGVLK